ncbi:MAG: hypothetical protein AAFW48_17915, partial [Pseudomonadota bacterium]
CNFPTNAPNVVQGFPQVPYPISASHTGEHANCVPETTRKATLPGKRFAGNACPGSFKNALLAM